MMKTYIAVSDFDLGFDKETYEDGTTIERLFRRVAIIRTDSEPLIEWLSVSLDIIEDDFALLEYIPNDSSFDKQWAHKHSSWKGNKTYQFWDRFQTLYQSSKAICIIDTGIAPHSDLDSQRITINYNGDDVVALSIKGNGAITKHTSLSDTTQYCHPHGTHVAGIAGAIINNNKGIAGVYQNKLFSINVFEEIDYFGQKYVGAYMSSILSALSICKLHADEIRTINMSLGGGYTKDNYYAYLYAFQELAEVGIIVVVAGGNSGYDIGIWKPLPAYVKTVNSFTIGSSNKDGVKSWFSNYNYIYCDCFVAGGTVVEALQSGHYEEEDILSCLPADTTDEVYNSFVDGDGDRYGYMAGTSMASPYACGLINILYELLEAEYSNQPFATLCNYIRLALAGATYNHTEEAFEQVLGGGIIDTSLLNNELIRPVIQSYSYDDDNEKLLISIRNFTSQTRTVWVSVASNQFVSPFEQSNSNLITTASQSVGAGQTYQFQISISKNNWYSLEKVGILTAFYDGSNVVGVYSKERYYNILECPTSPCQNIIIRCADEVYLPFDSSKYPITLAGMLSDIAERAQKRLLFFFNSQKNQSGRYVQYYPVATNGVCLNTINYPNATHQFQVREDANIVDVMYAYYTIYMQLKRIYDNGFIYDNKRWFVFDYEEWRKGKTKYRRKKLPDEYVLDESYLRRDKIGKVVEAINMMVYWSRVVFSVNYTLEYAKDILSGYLKNFQKQYELPLGLTTSFTTYQGGFVQNLYPSNYTDGEGNLRTRWNGTIFGFTDIYNVIRQNDWYTLDHANLHEGVNGQTVVRFNDILSSILLIGLSTWRKAWFPIHYIGENGYGEVNLDYYFGYLPENIKMVDENPNIQQYNVKTYSQMSGWQTLSYSSQIGGYYSDMSYTPISQEPLTYDCFYTENISKGYYGGLYAPILDKVSIDTNRLVYGEYSYIRHNLNCAVDVDIPITLKLKGYFRTSTHADTASKYIGSNPNNTCYPATQKAVGKFSVVVEKGSGTSYEELLNKTYYLSSGGDGTITFELENITADLAVGEHIRIKIEPDYNFIINSNPTHSLILFDNFEADIQIPPITEYTYVDVPDNSTWEDKRREYKNAEYTGKTNYKACYTRDCGCGVFICSPMVSGQDFKYPDLRGLPIDDKDDFEDLLMFLGVHELYINEEDERFKVKWSGWRKLGDNDPIGEVVVDQMPPFGYPITYKQDGTPNKYIYLCVGNILIGTQKAKRKKVSGVDAKLSHLIQCVNLHGNNYIMPANNVIYELDDEFDKRLSIAGTISSNIPNLIGMKWDGEKIEDYELDEALELETTDLYYHPYADGETIKYQFPTHIHFLYGSKIIIGVPQSSDINDYEVIYIPDLRGLTSTEIEAAYQNNFDIVSLGKCVSSFSENIVADQFPRGGVWRIKKGYDKIKIWILYGNKSTNIEAKVLNYAL